MIDIGSISTLLISRAEDDSALRKIVRGQLYFHGIAWYQADVMLAHLAADVIPHRLDLVQLALNGTVGMASQAGLPDVVLGTDHAMAGQADLTGQCFRF